MTKKHDNLLQNVHHRKAVRLELKPRTHKNKRVTLSLRNSLVKGCCLLVIYRHTSFH